MCFEVSFTFFGVCYVFQSARKQWCILFKRKVRTYNIIWFLRKKVEQKVTQKNFNQHVILENLRWVYSYYTKIQCVFYTLINSYFIPYGHILRNFLLVYKTFDMFRVWVGKLFHGPIHDNSCFCFPSTFIKRSISSASN